VTLHFYISRVKSLLQISHLRSEEARCYSPYVKRGVRFTGPEEVGPFLLYCREQAKMTQSELAALLIGEGANPRMVENKRTQISNWENGVIVPGGLTTLRILELTGSLVDPEPEERMTFERFAMVERQLRDLLSALEQDGPQPEQSSPAPLGQDVEPA
jgi:transcriptional regulator with XRE-family HTH domain